MCEYVAEVVFTNIMKIPQPVFNFWPLVDTHTTQITLQILDHTSRATQ